MSDEIAQFCQSFCRIEDFGIKPMFPRQIVAAWVFAHGPQFRDIGGVIFIGLNKAFGQ